MAAPLDPDRPVRWGILGAGAIARTVGEDIAASPDSVVQAVAARDGDRARALASHLGAATGHDGYDALLENPDVDVVYVATTHAQHHRQVRAVLEAGKPALVEKSFTVDAVQAQDLAELARARDLFCMEAVWTRCLPLFREAVAVVAGGGIGPVVGLRTDLCRAFPYDPASRLWDPATGGGALLDLGIYTAHVAHAFLGAPSTVTATGALAPNGVDVTAASLWGYPDGTVAQLLASFGGVTDGPHTVVSGRDGWLALHGRTHEPARMVVHHGDEEREVGATRAGHGYGPEVAEVQRALRAGETESPLVPLSATVEVLRALDRARADLGVHYGALEGI